MSDTPSWPLCTLVRADGSVIGTDAVDADHRYGPTSDGAMRHVPGWGPDDGKIRMAGFWRGNMADVYAGDLGGKPSGHPEGTPDAT